MFILGVSYGTHDTSACLLHDGKIIAAAEEERFNKDKSTSAFPVQAIDFCLHAANIEMSDVSCVALPTNPHEYRRSISYIPTEEQPACVPASQVEYVTRNLKNILNIMGMFQDLGYSPSVDTRVMYFNHHLAHAASAFYTSGYESSAVVVVDGVGEIDTITIHDGCQGELRTLLRQTFPHSLGKVYGAVCRYLGFWGASKEGKVMGLSAYGHPVYVKELERILDCRQSDLPSVDTTYFQLGITPLQPSLVSDKFMRSFGKARSEEEPINQRHMDIAYSLQSVLESTLVRVMSHAKLLTGRDSLCYAGGVAVNCSANGNILSERLFRRLYVPPAPNDAGLSIGAAHLAFRQTGGCTSFIGSQDAYLGPQYDDEDALSAADHFGLQVQRITDPAIVAARLLANGEVVGWFQGRMEFGPRALGNRSILADPRDPSAKEYLNSLIKDREMFRPFAPAILVDSASEVFDCQGDSPYMSFTFPVKPHWRIRIPAVVHVDSTARIQMVYKETNPQFYQLIRYFHGITGIPLVLNTSLNGKDEPIANSPYDACRIMVKTGLPNLIIGNCFLTRCSCP